MAQPHEVPLTPILELFWECKSGGAARLQHELDVAFAPFVDQVAGTFERSLPVPGDPDRGDGSWPADRLRPMYRSPARADAVEAELSDHEDSAKLGQQVAGALAASSDRTLHVEGASHLDASFVDFQVSVLRTPRGVQFPEIKPPGKALWADLLLRGEDDVPVVGEVQLRRDVTPVLSAIQLLVYVAHLAPEHQYKRLSVTSPGAPTKRPVFRAWSPDEPILDAYVLLADQGEPEAGAVAGLHEQAPRFIQALAQDERVARVIRRFELLRVDGADGGAAGDTHAAGGSVTATRLTLA